MGAWTGAWVGELPEEEVDPKLTPFTLRPAQAEGLASHHAFDSDLQHITVNTLTCTIRLNVHSKSRVLF